MPAGRPSLYDSKFSKQAHKLRLIMNASDLQLCVFFDITPQTLYNWKNQHTEFSEALIVSQEERQSHLEYSNVQRRRKNFYNTSYSRRRRQDPHQRLLDSTRARMYAALKGRSNCRLFSRLGYSLSDLVNHLESLFQSGMSWDNYGDWHVDHVIPCSKFDLSNSVQFNSCWALTNLQPLWAHDNLSKGASY